MLSHLAVIYTLIYTIGMYVGIIGTIGTYGGSLNTMLVTFGLCYVHTHTYIYKGFLRILKEFKRISRNAREFKGF